MTELLIRVACVALAAYRVARLIAADSITLPTRKRIYRLAFPGGDSGEIMHPWDWLYGLISCPHCIGFWSSLGMWWLWSLGHCWLQIVAVLAAAGVQSYLSSRADL